MSAPLISIALDADEGDYVLEATSHSRTAPAGPRLFRGGDFPLINWRHADRESAEHDRALLQAYLDAVHSGKQRKAKRGAEEAEQVAVPVADLSGAWWNE